MGSNSEREKTTEYATTAIYSLLENKDYISALLLSSIYAQIRLRSIVTDRLFPAQDKWKRTSKNIGISFRKLVNLCYDLELLDIQEKTDLKHLWTKRCNVAHESTLWKKLLNKEEKEIDQVCNTTIQFLKRTKYKPT